MDSAATMYDRESWPSQVIAASPRRAPMGKSFANAPGARSEEPRKWQPNERPPRRPLDRRRKHRRRSPSDRRRSPAESRRGRSRRPVASPRDRRLRVRGSAPMILRSEPRLERYDEKGRLATGRAGLIFARCGTSFQPVTNDGLGRPSYGPHRRLTKTPWHDRVM
jgi:hypothetical protein